VVTLNFTLVVELVLFLIFLWGATVLIIRPTLRVIDERDRHVGEQESEAAESETRAAELEKEYHHETANLRRIAEGKYYQARRQAVEEQRQLLENKHKEMTLALKHRSRTEHLQRTYARTVLRVGREVGHWGGAAVNPTVRWLAGYFVAYAAVAVTVNVFFGPPGYSNEYLDEYKEQHDRYLSITKSKEYKLWEENPDANPPDEGLAEDIEFVQQYEARGEFAAEQRRRTIYETILDFFNVFMIVLLAYRFGKAPLLNFLDGKIEEIRGRIEEAERARETALTHKAEAESKLANLDHVKARIERETEGRIALETRRIHESTEHNLSILEKEKEDRLRHEELLARQAVKAELVDRAIEEITKGYENTRSKESERHLMERFVLELENQR